MLNTLNIIAIGAGILIAALLGLAATKPDTFRVQRTKSIQAPPEKLFALVNDFRRWGSWSPYEKLDPAMKRTHSGAANAGILVAALLVLAATKPDTFRVQRTKSILAPPEKLFARLTRN